jgi:hypothetical protein
MYRRLVGRLPGHVGPAGAQLRLGRLITRGAEVVWVKEGDIDVGAGRRPAIAVQVIPDSVADNARADIPARQVAAARNRQN